MLRKQQKFIFVHGYFGLASRSSTALRASSGQTAKEAPVNSSDKAKNPMSVPGHLLPRSLRVIHDRNGPEADMI